MPAHCSERHVGVKATSNGALLSLAHIQGNALVDVCAKREAQRDRLSVQQLGKLRREVANLFEAAVWLGKVTHMANNFRNPHWSGKGCGQPKFWRDAQGQKAKPKPKATATATTQEPPTKLPGDLSACKKWSELRERVLAKERLGVCACLETERESWQLSERAVPQGCDPPSA